MLTSLSSINPQLLVRPTAARQENFAADAPDGYQASRNGTEAGGRVQPGAESLSDRGEAKSDATHDSQENELSDSEQAEVRKLQMRDQEVRAHEQAHAATGGRYAGSPSYEFKRGPDGRQYANGGEVSIDASAISGDPQATLAKMQLVRRAALAPAQPSGQDRQVAAQASQQETQARSDLAAQGQEDQQTGNDDDSSRPGSFGAEEDSKTAQDVGKSASDRAEARSAAPGTQFANAIRDQRGSLFANRAYLAHG